MDFDSSDEELMTVALYLQWILDNLECIQNVENPSVTIYSDELNAIADDLSFALKFGLRDNILSKYLHQREIDDLFKSWDEFGGKLVYPCDDRDDFMADEPVNLYLNPKRVSLIKHILERINGELKARDECY